MHLTPREQSGVLVLTVSGRIDHATSEEFAQALDTFLAQCTRDGAPCLLDFSEVDYITSAGLRVLMVASRRAKAQQGTFAIAALQPLVQEIFTISRFNLIMQSFPSVDAACKTLGQ